MFGGSGKRKRKPPLFRPAGSVPSRGCRAPGPLPCSGKRKRKPPVFRPADSAHCSVPASFHTPYAGLGALQFLLGSCLGVAGSANGNPPCSVPRVLRTVPSRPPPPGPYLLARSANALFRPAVCAHCSVPLVLRALFRPGFLLYSLSWLRSSAVFAWILVLQFFHRSCQGGATGPGLKSRSCRTASGTGGLVSRPLGSPEPLGTGSACFSRVSEPSVARTVIES